MRFQPISTRPSWDDVAALQDCAANQRHLDYKAWAMEEQLDSLVQLVALVPLSEATDAHSKPILNLVANRSKKYRRRERLLRDSYRHICRSSYECTAVELLLRRERIAAIRARLVKSDQQIFEGLADGDDYLTIAVRQKMTLGALKSKIGRCRDRLRQCS